MNTLQAAKSWIMSGFSIIPIGYRSKRPAFDALRWTGCTTDTESGPQPAWEMFKHRAATEHELEQLFAGPRRNLGIVTGYNGLVVLDFDHIDAYEAWSCWASHVGGRIAGIAATTYRVFSARGAHVYLIVDEQVDSYKVSCIDIKARWGYVLAPPSVHPNGHVYHSTGGTIARIARLSDIFPFERQSPEPRVATVQSHYTADPWEAATNATEYTCESSVADIKARVQTIDLVTVTHQDSRGAWALCPLHRDTNPSFRVYPDGGWHCFGCQASGGDVIDLHAAIHHLTNREAIAELSRM